jgi:hypothetical protein
LSIFLYHNLIFETLVSCNYWLIEWLLILNDRLLEWK